MPAIVSNFSLYIHGETGAPAFTAADFSTLTINSKVYTSAGLSSSSSVLDLGINKSSFLWNLGDGEYEGGADALTNGGTYSVVID